MAPSIRQLFAAAGLRYPAHQLLIRIFKADDQVELWVQPAADRSFVQLKTYPICARSGTLGPKRVAGDRQVPEGFYRIDRFNPASRFHLSLGLDYPNASDKVLSDPDRPGGDIFIHGSCVTIGCVPLTDRLIKELYIIALDAHEAGKAVPVHVFPRRMGGASWTKLEEIAGADATLQSFWENLREGYRHFETHKRLPTIGVDSRGRYSFR
ncbi:MAG: L,D-transpeptidase family protein [Deltaproteobacteria bacterium]|nr:L,D-transpeptidase family protein [Deltaproteobacteria bacterium]